MQGYSRGKGERTYSTGQPPTSNEETKVQSDSREGRNGTVSSGRSMTQQRKSYRKRRDTRETQGEEGAVIPADFKLAGTVDMSSDWCDGPTALLR